MGILGAVQRCFQCGTSVPSEQLTQLGDGVFCRHCFQELLEADPAPAAQSSGAAPASVSPPASAPKRTGHSEQGRRHCCLVCEQPLGSAATPFPGGAICMACTTELNAEVAAAAATEQSPPTTEATATSGHRAARPTDQAQQTGHEAQTSTPGSQTVVCAGCERLMPGPGSYRMLAGKRYCAGCVPFYERHPQPDEVKPQATPGNACESCGREPEGSASRVEGFLLCVACQEADLELALGVARARHRRGLVALAEDLKRDRK